MKEHSRLFEVVRLVWVLTLVRMPKAKCDHSSWYLLGGSVRISATFNGIFFLKSTHTRLSYRDMSDVISIDLMSTSYLCILHLIDSRRNDICFHRRNLGNFNSSIAFDSQFRPINKTVAARSERGDSTLASEYRRCHPCEVKTGRNLRWKQVF
jgi:hypothetical protein